VWGGAWSDAWSDALSCGLCVYSFDGFQNKRRSEFWTKMTEIWVTSVNDHFDEFIVCNSCALSILFLTVEASVSAYHIVLAVHFHGNAGRKLQWIHYSRFQGSDGVVEGRPTRRTLADAAVALTLSR